MLMRRPPREKGMQKPRSRKPRYISIGVMMLTMSRQLLRVEGHARGIRVMIVVPKGDVQLESGQVGREV